MAAIRLAVAAPLALAALAFVGPGAVLADCAEPPAIEATVVKADMVFVGTVTNASNNRRWAEVAVQEVWRGPDQPLIVLVRGGPEGNTMTSVDRSFEIGRTYLFVPYVDAATNALEDNSCTSTTEFTDEIASLRPADARQPIGSQQTAPGGFDVESLAPFALVGVVFLVLLAIGLLARGRQET